MQAATVDVAAVTATETIDVVIEESDNVNDAIGNALADAIGVELEANAA